MSKKYLDSRGLSYLWQKVRDKYIQKLSIPGVENELIYFDTDEGFISNQLLLQDDVLFVNTQEDYNLCTKTECIESDVLSSWQQFQCNTNNTSDKANDGKYNTSISPEYGKGVLGNTTKATHPSSGYGWWYNDGTNIKNDINSGDFNGYIMPFNKNKYSFDTLFGCYSNKSTSGDQIGFSVVNDKNALPRRVETTDGTYYRNTLYDKVSVDNNDFKHPSQSAWVKEDKINNTAKVIFTAGPIEKGEEESFPTIDSDFTVYDVENIRTSVGRKNPIKSTTTVKITSTHEATGYLGLLTVVVTNSTGIELTQGDSTSYVSNDTGTIYVFGSVFDIKTKKWNSTKIIDGSVNADGNYWKLGKNLVEYNAAYNGNDANKTCIIRCNAAYNDGKLEISFGDPVSYANRDSADFNGSKLSFDFKSKTYSFESYHENGTPIHEIKHDINLSNFTPTVHINETTKRLSNDEFWNLFTGDTKFMYNAYSYGYLYIKVLNMITDGKVIFIHEDNTNTEYELNEKRTEYISKGNIQTKDILTGSRLAYNPITKKLFYSNGEKIYQISGGTIDKEIINNTIGGVSIEQVKYLFDSVLNSYSFGYQREITEDIKVRRLEDSEKRNLSETYGVDWNYINIDNKIQEGAKGKLYSDEVNYIDEISDIKYVDLLNGGTLFNCNSVIIPEDDYNVHEFTYKYSSGVEGTNAFAEGDATLASGNSSHAEGEWNTAYGDYSHAEGESTTAQGQSSHAEGEDTLAIGDVSHAEGSRTLAVGNYSHTEGYDTVAQNAYEHSQGVYNVSNKETETFGDKNTIFSVGIGKNDEERKNALEVLQNGDIYINNVGDYDGTNALRESNITGKIARSLQDALSDTPGYTYVKESNAFIEGENQEWLNSTPTVYKVHKLNNEEKEALDFSGSIGINYDYCIHCADNAILSIIYDDNKTNLQNAQLLRCSGCIGVDGNIIIQTPNNSNLGNIELKFFNLDLYDENDEQITLENDTDYYFSYPNVGINTHIEGSNSIASGVNSHAEGKSTTASGYASHAEGSFTVASGTVSHAEGSGSIGIRDASHAEGYYTIAQGDASHAEGNATIASGNQSHAEGDTTHATGVDSHAEGFCTIASGNISHAEGELTTARGYASHAEGSGFMDIETYTQKTTIKIFSDADYLANVYENTGIDFNYFTDAADAVYILTGAELYNPNDTDLENAIGEIAISKYIGGYSDTIPERICLGIEFYDGYTADAFPEQDGGKLVVVSQRSGSYGTYSHSEGCCTIARGEGSHTEGGIVLACNEFSHAEGILTNAYGMASHAEGYYDLSFGNFSHAEGYMTTAKGDASHAEGINTLAKGEFSHAEGYMTTASGECSHAEGVYNIAPNDAQHVSGKFATVDETGTAIFQVGIGNDQEDRKDALRIKTDGDIIIQQDNQEIVLQDKLDSLQKQIDGEISSWFFEGEPTTSNTPANEWTTDELKQRHGGDTYTNISSSEDDSTGGQSWRWCNVNDEYGDGWHWHKIADSDAVKALAEAAKAQQLANTANTNATNALNTANTANTNATNALNTATAAQTTANNAQTIATEVRQDFDNLEIGGRNLLLNSKPYNNTNWKSNGTSNVTFTEEGTIKCQTTGEWARIYTPQFRNFELKLDDEYTLSMLVRANASGTRKIYLGTDNASIININFNDIPVTTEWSRVVKTAKVINTDTTGGTTWFQIYSSPWNTTNNNDFIEFKEIKLEQGNKSTAWTPAPEDIQNGYTWDVEKNSFAVGKNINTASGNYSFAEGQSTTASGNYSHSEGYKSMTGGTATTNDLTAGTSTAAGAYAHAEGNATIAKGRSSHSEGQKTFASGQGSHAEGGGTTTSGMYSHAEGMKTIAKGSTSHAEGNSTKAEGQASHAEGDSTTASGNYSHAEGQSTTVGGSWSHAEGYKTTVTRNCSHAEGDTNIISGDYSHAEGKCNTLISAPNSHIEGANNALFFSNSHAEGSENISHGYISHIEGNLNTVTGYAAHAEGFGNIASGDSAHVEGGIAYKESNYKYDVELNSANYNSSTGILECVTKTEIPDDKVSSCIAANFHYGTGSWDHKCYWIANIEKVSTTNYKLQLHADALSCITNGIKPDPSTIGTIIKLSLIRRGNIASGNSSHAEGYNTQAKGNQSHTEGSSTIATGNSAHAEGFSTVASGSFSHAEGSHTESMGRDSHSEGAYNKAIGIASHTEGEYTTAQGVASHAEGYSTYANGENSHAEGRYTRASGDCSHAEGCGYYEPEIQEIVIKKFANEDFDSIYEFIHEYTGIDFNYFTDAEDYNNLNGAWLYAPDDTDLENTIGKIVISKYVEGYGDGDITPTSTYLKIIFYGDDVFDTLPDQDNGKLVSVVPQSGSYDDFSHSEGEITIAQGYASHAEGTESSSSGAYSHAEGYRTISEGNYSHSEGCCNISNGDYSHSEGYYNTSSGDTSHTEGSSNIALGECSHAEGIGNKASGDYSHVEGQSTTAEGHSSHTEGVFTTASGFASHAEGDSTSAQGEASHTEGTDTRAFGDYSHAEGSNTTSSGECSHAEGTSTTASGSYSHAEGSWTTASGDCSHVEGLDGTAEGYASHVEGEGSTASGYASHAEGQYTTASGAYSHAEGGSSTANGYYAHTEGYNTTTGGSAITNNLTTGTFTDSGSYAHAEGNATIARGISSHTEGEKTFATGVASHAEGYRTIAGLFGSSTNNLTAGTATDAGSYAHAEGNATIAKGISSHAEGQKTFATGTASHAEGQYTTASGHFSHAEGNTTTASGMYSHAEGASTTASGSAAHAGGISCTASHANTLVFGRGLVSGTTDQTVIGKFNKSMTDLGNGVRFIIGSGSNDVARKNLVVVQDGENTSAASGTGGLMTWGPVKSGVSTIGDFGEYFEWLDGNPNNEDRIGYMVQLNGDKIELATAFTRCIGVISGTASFLSGACSLDWQGRFLKDKFGRYLKDENGEFIVNPDYNPDLEYIPREQRKEWDVVGLVGQVITRQDGTLTVGGHAGVKNGIATNATNGYRVLRIIDNETALLLVK